mmetsp:Transcript_1065/g.3623  ORF Transcript_1065/g.3623 Transcript_1065/m.3623 type:complete len:275 (-) Transcript_1065:555-1379(-)
MTALEDRDTTILKLRWSRTTSTPTRTRTTATTTRKRKSTSPRRKRTRTNSTTTTTRRRVSSTTRRTIVRSLAMHGSARVPSFEKEGPQRRPPRGGSLSLSMPRNRRTDRPGSSSFLPSLVTQAEGTAGGGFAWLAPEEGGSPRPSWTKSLRVRAPPVAFLRSLAPSFMRWACHWRMRGSTVSSTTRRTTRAGLVCPMREMRPAAWASTPGWRAGSRRTAVVAWVRVRPAAPPPPAPDAPPKRGTRRTVAPPTPALFAKSARAACFLAGEPMRDA